MRITRPEKGIAEIRLLLGPQWARIYVGSRIELNVAISLREMGLRLAE